MFGRMKRVKEQLVEVVNSYVIGRANALELYQRLIKQIDDNFRLTSEHAKDAIAQYEKKYQDQQKVAKDNFFATYNTLRELLPLSGRSYDDSVWLADEWTKWKSVDNQGKKLDERTIDSDYFKAQFPDNNLLSEYVMFGTAFVHNSVPDLPLFYSPTIHGNLVVSTRYQDKTTVYDFMYSMVLRLMTAGRPGSVNLIMIDPVKLGEKLGTFSTAFRELPRAKSLIQGGLALTEERQIEDELVQLRTRIAEIVQTMGDNYQTLQQFNAASNDIQEPYRILLIRDFPKSFSRNAVEKLVSIMNSGPKCGVYTVIHIDETMTKSDPATMARGQQLTEQELIDHYYKSKFDITRSQITERGILLQQDAENQFRVYVSEEIRQRSNAVTTQLLNTVRTQPIRLNCLPQSDIATNVANTIATLHALGDSLAIPIPATQDGQLWRGNSTKSLSIDVGMAARNEVLSLDFSDQYVNGLVVGRIGSGKSNLLHVIIQQLSAKYSPAELSLYLIDLKQAEFHVYGQYKLPHARVVASKTDRAFCLNVLQEVYREIEKRNNMFTLASNEFHSSVVNLEEYRTVTGRVMPQLLLIADEFTVLFSVDDKISIEARRLIEQIAKLGRSSGIHLLLATQALQHNTLSATVKDQFVIRIALQCDNSTIETIFGAHNQLARTLKRRGEAIINSNAGSEEANRRAQIFIGPKDKNVFVERIRKCAETQLDDVQSPIVFEGHIPSRIGDNPNIKVTKKTMRIVSNQPIRWYFGQELTLANTHVDTGLYDVMSNNIIIVGAKQYEAFVSNLMLAGITSIARQYDARSIDINVIDATFSAESNSRRLEHALKQLGDNVNDVTEDYMDTVSRLADLIYQRKQQGRYPEKVEMLVLVGVPRNISTANRGVAIPKPTASVVSSEGVATPFEVGSEEARKRAELLQQMRNASTETNRDLSGMREAFRQSYDDQNKDASGSMSIDMSGAPSRGQTSYLKLLQYIIEHGPEWRVHTVLWLDGVNSVQTYLGSSRSVIDQLFNTRVMFPMSTADASRFSENDAKIVDAFVPINSFGDWPEPRISIYDRTNNTSTVVRPYGEIKE